MEYDAPPVVSDQTMVSAYVQRVLLVLCVAFDLVWFGGIILSQETKVFYIESTFSPSSTITFPCSDDCAG